MHNNEMQPNVKEKRTKDTNRTVQEKITFKKLFGNKEKNENLLMDRCVQYSYL
jgi:hypothetical protein